MPRYHVHFGNRAAELLLADLLATREQLKRERAKGRRLTAALHAARGHSKGAHGSAGRVSA